MKKTTIKLSILLTVLVGIWLYLFFIAPVKMMPQGGEAFVDYAQTISQAFIYSSVWIAIWFTIFGLIPFLMNKKK